MGTTRHKGGYYTEVYNSRRKILSPFKKLGSHENTITQTNRADGEFSELADVSKEDGNVRVAQ